MDGGRTEDEQVSPVSIPRIEVLALQDIASVWLPGKVTPLGKRDEDPLPGSQRHSGLRYWKLL